MISRTGCGARHTASPGSKGWHGRARSVVARSKWFVGLDPCRRSSSCACGEERTSRCNHAPPFGDQFARSSFAEVPAGRRRAGAFEPVMLRDTRSSSTVANASAGSTAATDAYDGAGHPSNEKSRRTGFSRPSKNTSASRRRRRALKSSPGPGSPSSAVPIGTRNVVFLPGGITSNPGAGKTNTALTDSRPPGGRPCPGRDESRSRS